MTSLSSGFLPPLYASNAYKRSNLLVIKINELPSTSSTQKEFTMSLLDRPEVLRAPKSLLLLLPPELLLLTLLRLPMNIAVILFRHISDIAFSHEKGMSVPC